MWNVHSANGRIPTSHVYGNFCGVCVYNRLVSAEMRLFVSEGGGGEDQGWAGLLLCLLSGKLG